MSGRLEDEVAIIVGAGSTAGETMGNRRGTAILFAREGASVLLVDRDRDSAEETKRMIDAEDGVSSVCGADITCAEDCRRMAEQCVGTYGRIDILHNNVGIGALGGPERHQARRASRLRVRCRCGHGGPWGKSGNAPAFGVLVLSWPIVASRPLVLIHLEDPKDEQGGPAQRSGGPPDQHPGR